MDDKHEGDCKKAGEKRQQGGVYFTEWNGTE